MSFSNIHYIYPFKCKKHKKIFLKLSKTLKETNVIANSCLVWQAEKDFS